MRKVFLFVLLLCGINYSHGQGLFGKLVNKAVEKQLQAKNYIFSNSSEILQIKKNGKTKKVSEIGYGGIDTLFVEDPNMPVGKVVWHPLLEYKDIKAIFSNNIAYNIFIYDKVVKESAEEYKIPNFQGFMAMKLDQYDNNPNKSTFKGIKILSLPDAVIIDGEVGGMCGFFAQTGIEKIIFSPKMRKIGKGAFRDCRYLEEVVFPDGCNNVEIDPQAFVGCDALKSIRIPKGTTQDYVKMGVPEALLIDGEAGIELEISLEKPGTILDKLPLEKLNKISSLSVVGFLDENDFAVIRDCINLKKLDLSHAYTTLSEKEQTSRNANKQFLLGMFQAMGKLSEEKYKNGEITVTENLEVQLFAQLAKDESQVKNASEGCVIPWNSLKGLSKLETVYLPFRASTIEANAFSDCTSLKAIVLPKYLESINDGSFKNCKSLKSIDIPSTLKYCNSSAFEGCESLTKLDFGRCQFEKGDGYFKYDKCNNLKTICLPEGIKVLRDIQWRQEIEYFMPKSIKRFDTTIDNCIIHFKGTEPPIVETSSHSYKPRGCTIYVPKGSMTKYYATFKGEGNVLKEE